MSAGYANKFEVYCHDDQDDETPVLLEVGVEAVGTGKANCDGLTRLSASPVSTSGFKTFKQK